MNVSTSKTGETQFVNAGQLDNNGSPEYEPYKLIKPSTLVACLLYIALVGV